MLLINSLFLSSIYFLFVNSEHLLKSQLLCSLTFELAFVLKAQLLYIVGPRFKYHD